MRIGVASLVGVLALSAVGSCQGAPAAPRYPDFAVPRLEGVTVPGLPPITGRIHVDQFGYLPDGDKVAVISNPQRGYNAHEEFVPGATLRVIRVSDQAVVFSGSPVPWRDGAIHEDSGDSGWWFDFSSLRTPGEYTILCEKNNLRSPVFRIDENVYRDVLRAAVRTFFYQRLSWDFREPYAEPPWVLPRQLDEDKRTRALWAKDDVSLERDLSGGWMDAGDTNKYPPFNADVVSALLYAYTENPEVFGDDFGIPESGNGLPDLLDELKYQLDWLVKMQDTDGGVFIKMGHLRDRNQDGGRFANTRFYGPKCTGATITFAMNTAHAARVYRQFPQWREFADQLQRQAELAWRYYRSNPRTTDVDTGEIVAGIANRDLVAQDFLEALAGIHLWALTGRQEYHDAVIAKAGAHPHLSEGVFSSYWAGIGEALVEYIRMPGADPALSERIRQSMRNSARSERFAPPVETDLYRAWMNPEAYHWGSNFVRASFGFNAHIIADHGGLSPEDTRHLRQRARDMLHSFHGVNPLSAVKLTNMGRYGAELSMTRIWHERFNYNTPLAANPPPGYVVGGPNQMFDGTNGDRAEDITWIRQQPRAKAYADFNESWPMGSWAISENSTGYQSTFIRLLAGVMRR